MTAPVTPTYKATKPEWYSAIGQALDDPAMAATDASILQESVENNNPNWRPCKKNKFKKYYKRVIAAKEAGIDPKEAGNLVGDDASVSTIGSMASRAKNFIISKTSGTISGSGGSPTNTGSPSRSISASKQDDVSDIASTTTGKTFGSIKKKLGSIKKSMKSSSSSTPRVPGSIGGPFFSPSPLKEEPIRGEGVEYSAVPPPILSDGTADITPDHSDRELDLSTSAYVDENDNDGSKGKKDECCSQGCIIL